MTGSLARLLPCRSLTTETFLPLPTRRLIHVHTLKNPGLSQQLNEMFQRAHQKYEGERPTKAPAPTSSTAGNSLKQQLFPSSSHNVAHNADKVEIARKPGLPSSTFRKPGSLGLYSRAPPAQPLQPVSANSAPPASSRSSAPTTYLSKPRALASLYKQSDSFKEEPDVIDLSGDEAVKPRTRRPEAPVFIDIDDFSDDDTLDFAAPPTLPPQPTLPTPKRQSAPAIGSEASVLSWSQSSPSHMLPPQPPHNAEPTGTSSKRSSFDLEPEPVERVAKKRAMPSHWNTAKKTSDLHSINLDAGHSKASRTPAPKSKDALPWDTTQSAIKDQKKQLRVSQKKSAVADNDLDNDRGASAKTSAPKKATVIALSKEQRHVQDLVCLKNQSVFFTGPAGTGKSVLMRAIIHQMKDKFARDPERLAVTASTGLAACNIGGMTLHSFAGIGLGKEDVQALVKKIRRNPKAKNRWLRTKVLVIDEVSMVDAELFDKLSQIGRTIRNNGRPWGGIQLVITGDFFQLPPVPDGDKKREVKFAFEAGMWNTSIDHTIGLTEVFRQKDPAFATMLNEMRLGRIAEATVQSFKSLARPLEFDDGMEVTELFPTRNEVEASNERRLKALGGSTQRYDAIESGDPQIRDRLLQNMMAPKSLELKKGAQVMLIKNLDETLVNGSLGTVEAFMSENEFSFLGPSDPDAPMEADADPAALKRIQAFSRQLQTDSGPSRDGKKYPLVRFHAVDGSQRTILVMPEEWTVELPNGEKQASRKQVPLILAWALSIHKAQGQTLERVKVDLGRIFEKGQAYVALSRATSQQGLQVLRFDKTKVMAHPRVVDFYNKLYTADVAVSKKMGYTGPAVAPAKVAPPAPVVRPSAQVVDMDDEEEAALAAYY